MSESLYSEAIAEAKQLRDVAEQNAKNAIIEAVTPKIREFIESQLVNESVSNESSSVLDSIVEDISESTVSDDDSVILDESALESLVSLLGGDDISSSMQAVQSRSLIINALNESVDKMTQEEREKLLSIAADLKVKADNLSEAEINTNDNCEQENIEENTTMSDNETLYEVDLDEIAEMLARELDEGLDELDIVVDEEDLEVLGVDDAEDLDLDSLDVNVMMSDMSEPEDEDDELDIEMDIDVDDEAPDDDEEVEIEDEEQEVVSEDLDEVFEVDLDMLRDELRKITLAEAQELVKVKGVKNDMAHHFGGQGDANVGTKGAFGGTGSTSGDSFGGGKESGDPLKVTLNKLSESAKKERRKNRALTAKLNEYRSAVETLREQLTEMNLFNAKLLYVNKLLQNKNVSPQKRKSIIEALDDARNLREVKLLYKSLTESLEDTKSKKQISESVRRTLGSSSRTVQSSSSTASRDADEVSRWAKLAGIKN
tara:strand:+ start:7613 stop:9070 length:1458 start_codon:yes stop_codon:yes gene_type:complete